MEAETVTGLALNHNISAGGMLIALSAELGVGEAITATFSLPKSKGEHTVHGRILRIERNREDPEGMWPYRVAVEFDDVSPDLVPLVERAASALQTTA